jgi:hypothetical protein
VTQLSTSHPQYGYLWSRSWVKDLPEDGHEYALLRNRDKPAKSLTESTPGLAPIRLGYQYDLRAKYEEAREKDDPLISPHGFFRSLKFQSRKHALEFTSNFGPLTWKPRKITRGTDLYTRVNLADFWAKHSRFCRVAALMENHLQPHQLRTAISILNEEISVLDAADSFPVGIPRVFREMSRRPVGIPQQVFANWIGSASDNAVREAAEDLVHNELIGHLHKRQPWWIRRRPELRFELTLLGGSLWHVMWEMLAWDTSNQTFWRICPHCGKLFYPPRCDRFYCTSRQQVLASKRQYAARQRAISKE